MSFAEKIYLIRTKNKLSQEEMASKFNVSRQTISKWESGMSYPEIDKLISISEMFDVSIDYLLKDNENRKDMGERIEKIIFQFLASSQGMGRVSEQLIDIMRDGIITDEERLQLENITYVLDEAAQTIENVKKIIINDKEAGIVYEEQKD
ncbi:helix-turn-helix domain-containing protein [Lachnospiraceae bacterium HCP1S3_C3]|nr:helix-turn-helix domain-containing protein [Lachnospiraceae bacterium]